MLLEPQLCLVYSVVLIFVSDPGINDLVQHLSLLSLPNTSDVYVCVDTPWC
jgi:hypothetical protein